LWVILSCNVCRQIYVLSVFTTQLQPTALHVSTCQHALQFLSRTAQTHSEAPLLILRTPKWLQPSYFLHGT
jgi:hypothetical protein